MYTSYSNNNYYRIPADQIGGVHIPSGWPIVYETDEYPHQNGKKHVYTIFI